MLIFSATQTAERGHPNAEGGLGQIIRTIFTSGTVTTLKALDSKVYEYLRQKNPNLKEQRYFFRHQCAWQQNGVITRVEVSVSDNLLIWLLANDRLLLRSIIQTYKLNIPALIDADGNTLLHMICFYGDHETLAIYFLRYESHENFSVWINQRNNDGTNPLGMAYYNALHDNRDHTNQSPKNRIVKSFINQRNFNVNAYLNNRRAMDYVAVSWWRDIGGYTCLHRALKEKAFDVLQILESRNITIKQQGLHAYFRVNFNRPTLNPHEHMMNPKRLAVAFQTQQAVALLDRCQAEQAEFEGGYDSGDSDDEESSAHYYKNILKQQAAVIDNNATTPLTEEEKNHLTALNVLSRGNEASETSERKAFRRNIVIPHFHGVPFMSGQYSHEERREVARKILDLNGKQDLKGLSSRTVTTTVGIDSLHILVNAEEGIFLRLREVNLNLKSYLRRCNRTNPDKFLQAVKTYIYSFADNPVAEFWALLGEIEQVPEEFVRHRFPFISTSKAPDHPIKFGFGVNVETQQRGELPVHPLYDGAGRPQRRLAGFLYITLHSFDEYETLFREKKLVDMPLLLKHGSPTQAYRTDYQNETVFFSGIDPKHIVAVIPLIYPNFSKAYEPGYHDKIWKLEDSDTRKVTSYYYQCKKFFNKAAPEIYKSDNKAISSEGIPLMMAYTSFALELVGAIAAKQGLQLCYMSTRGLIKHYPLGVIGSEGRIIREGGPNYKYTSLVQAIFKTSIRSPTSQILPASRLKITRSYSVSFLDDRYQRRLLKAAKNGDNESIDQFMRYGRINVNARNKKGNTPLLLAARWGRTSTVQLLIETYHADPKVRNNAGYSAVLLAAMGAHEKVIDLLITQYSANVYDKDDSYNTLFIIAARKKYFSLMDHLVKTYKLDLQAPDSRSGAKLLFWAAQVNRLDVLQWLLEKQGYLFSKNANRGKQALLKATKRNHFLVSRYLIQHGARLPIVRSINATARYVASVGRELQEELLNVLSLNGQIPDEMLFTVLARAPINWCITVRQVQCYAGSVQGDTPAHYALRLGHHRAIHWWVDNGIRFNVKNAASQTLLELATQLEDEDSVECLRSVSTTTSTTISAPNALTFFAHSQNASRVSGTSDLSTTKKEECLGPHLKIVKKTSGHEASTYIIEILKKEQLMADKLQSVQVIFKKYVARADCTCLSDNMLQSNDKEAARKLVEELRSALTLSRDSEILPMASSSSAVTSATGVSRELVFK